MFYLKPVDRMLMLAALITPTLALSEPVTLGYFARVELVMIGSENTSFVCANNDLPAQIEIDEDSIGMTSVNFPVSLLDRPTPPQIRVRRGVELVPERIDRTLTGFTNDWRMTVAGNINLCVGPATLQVIEGSLDVFARLGQYEANIISSNEVLQDLDISYETNASGIELVRFFHLERDGFPSEMNGQFVGSLPDDERDERRILGRLDFDDSQLAIRFTDPRNYEDVTHLTRLNIRLILEESASEFPNATIDAIVENGG